MDLQFKRELMSYLKTGCGHQSMTEAMACSKCGDRFKKGEAMYNRARKEHPELFVRKEPEFKPSEELKEMHANLVDRVKHDKMYREHLRKSQYGTIEEQNKEADIANSGFFRKNSGYSKRFL